MALQEVRIPDIGGDEAEVIEILVKVGDSVAEEAGLISLESDKATMDVPAPFSGVVKEIKVTVGDNVNEGDLVLMMEAESVAETAPAPEAETAPAPETETTAPTEASAGARAHAIKIPDIGGEPAEVIELLVKPGQVVAEEDGLISLESDKATMDVPAPFAGEIKSLTVKVGDKLEEGAEIGVMITAAAVGDSINPRPTPKTETIAPAVSTPAPLANAPVNSDYYGVGTDVHASPAVRRIAREFGVDLRKVRATGQKGRITVQDVRDFVKQALAGGGTSGAGLAVAPAPKVDFAKFGAVETLDLNKIKRATAKNLHRNWVTIPHVTQFDDADITDMEAFRQEQKPYATKQGLKLTPLVFIMKAVVEALKEFPQFNASLDPSGEHLILKKYFHIGIAVDTPNGLVVPVVKDVDKKGVFDLAKELAEISKKARDKQLKPQDMKGGCFSISSLGGIGGTGFTPIVNAPEVAILGVSRSKMQPVYVEKEFVPRLMLPLALSYDHRVVDGAEAARFITFLSKCLADIRNLLI